MFLRCCVYVTGFLCTWLVMPGLCENICPPVAEIHSRQEMVADISQATYTNFTWLSPIGDEVLFACETENGTCMSNDDNYSGNVTNGTASQMVIANVTTSDNGMWQLLDVISGERFNVCRIVTTKKPRCTINSDDDAHNVDIGDELTLKINITGYYCSDTDAFNLTTGDVSQILVLYDNNDTDIYVNETIDIMLTRFGDVTLDYSCQNSTWKLACDGVKKIIKSMPQCNISSDKNTDELDLGDELTLTAYIRGYYCPKAAVFALTTGGVQQMSQNYSVDNVTNTDINTTFIVALSHFGKIKLRYTCDGDTSVLACGGVKELVGRFTATSAVTHSMYESDDKKTVSTPEPLEESPIPMIVGSIVGVVLAIVLIVVIVRENCWKCKKTR